MYTDGCNISGAVRINNVAVSQLESPCDPNLFGKRADGFPLLCKHCNHFFASGEDQIYTYPKSPAGEGFKCEKCGKFGATTARRCDTCKNWFSSEDRGARCPRCNKDKPAERS